MAQRKLLIASCQMLELLTKLWIIDCICALDSVEDQSPGAVTCEAARQDSGEDDEQNNAERDRIEEQRV